MIPAHPSRISETVPSNSNTAARTRPRRSCGWTIPLPPWYGRRSGYRGRGGLGIVTHRWADVGWLIALGVLSSVWCLTAAARTGVTYDESFYVPAGLAGWRDGTCDRLAEWGTMPLPADVQTLPLYL